MNVLMKIIEFAFCFTLNFIHGCQFPKVLRDQTWYTDIRPSNDSRTAVFFWDDIIEFQSENTRYNKILYVSQKYCQRVLTSGRFVVSSERDPQSSSVVFSCVEFVFRSSSIVQLKTSGSFVFFSEEICDDTNIRLQPWLMVSYVNARKAHVVCPLSGGFNLRIWNKNGFDHICNSMDVPMRFESDCYNGEGIIFDLREDNCIGDLPMAAFQKATCITHWYQNGFTVTVVRKVDSDDIWCLLSPTAPSSIGDVNAFLFTDVSCPIQISSNSPAQYYRLELRLVVHNSLCADEHHNCHLLPCIPYFERHCLKSCGKCDPNIFPTACDFPRYARGDWSLNDKTGSRNISVSASRLRMNDHDDFDCISVAGSPLRATNKYTAISIFDNGCRPRYTCLNFQKMGPNSLGFAVSQSQTWPMKSENRIGSIVCNSENFHGDPPPLNDTYRTYNDVLKPSVTMSQPIRLLPCVLDHSFIINFTDETGTQCRGGLYQKCNSPSHIRLEINTNNCSSKYQKAEDFSCIGHIKGKYWEKLILLQNEKNVLDTRCLIFSEIKPNMAMMLQSAECDQFSWMFVDAGVRTPMFMFTVIPELEACKTLQQNDNDLNHGTDPYGDKYVSARNTYIGDDAGALGNGSRSTTTAKTRKDKDTYGAIGYSINSASSLIYFSCFITLFSTTSTCIIFSNILFYSTPLTSRL